FSQANSDFTEIADFQSCTKMSFRSSASGGGKWRGDITFVEYDCKQNTPTWERYSGENFLQHAIALGLYSEHIEKAKIWKYPLKGELSVLIGAWHEFTLVESTKWYWTFEKYMDGLYVQRAKKKACVKNMYVGDKRSDCDIRGEGRESNEITFQESIGDVISWIDKNKEQNKKYHLTQSNCHHFASRVYEAITRTAGMRLVDVHNE
ncbi:hypothetical protein PENTCL1PPCAC_201, partial [Pristionchus entomophagus]